MALLMMGFLLASCNNAALEERIAELEDRVARLETSPTAANQPSNTLSKQVAQQAEASIGSQELPAFSFEETSYDFGTIKEGQEVEHIFKFTNTGEAPLVIQSATATCGCTVPNYPREPVAPGESGEILVKFNSTNKPGIQNKTVSITANTQPTITRLTIKSNVEAAVAETAGPVRK
ncbi:MAG: DUF1573 domain-containing protein [Cyclobacteriaceae bacterium]